MTRRSLFALLPFAGALAVDGLPLKVARVAGSPEFKALVDDTLLETRRFSVEEIAEFCCLPPSAVKALT